MRCHDWREQWLAQRYGGVPLTAEAETHVGGCRACQAYSEQTMKLDGLLAADVNEPPRPGFDTRFFARLEEVKQAATQPTTQAGWGWKRWTLAGAAVLSLGVAVVAAVTLQVGRGHSIGGDDLAMVMELDMFKEDVNMLHDLETVEAFDALVQANGERQQ